MIGRVRGELAVVESDRVTLMTAGGVILVPSGVFEQLPGLGQMVDLHTTLVVRADALELFGFASPRDLELFLRLQAAAGVGPKLALSILSALPTRRIVGAIRGREPAVLQTVSGVGKKTAERLVLELADKLDDLGSADDGADSGAALTGTGAALEALRSLGYSAVEAEAAVAVARRESVDGQSGTEDLVRAALRHL